MTWGWRRFLATSSSPSAPREPIPGSWLANKYLHLPSSSKEHSYTRFLHREHVPVILPHPARGAQSHGEDIRAPTPHPWKSRPFLQQGPNTGGATERVTPKSISGGGRSPCPAPRPAPPLSEISSVLFASSHMLPALIEAKYKPSSSCSPKFPFPPLLWAHLPSARPHPPLPGALGSGGCQKCCSWSSEVLGSRQGSGTHTQQPPPRWSYSAAISMPPETRSRDYGGGNKERAKHIYTEA